MQKLTIRQKLGLLLLAPIVSALISLWQIVPVALDQLSGARSLEIGIRIAAASTTLTYQLQAERSAGAGLISAADNRSVHRNRYVITQETADTALSDFVALLAEAQKDQQLAEGVKRLLAAQEKISDNLKVIREKVFGSSSNMTFMLAAYGDIVDELTIGASALSAFSSRERIANTRQVLDNLMIANENLGIERALGSALINEDETEAGLRERMIVSARLQDRFYRLFETQMGEAGRELIDRHMSRAAIDAYLQKRNELIEASRIPGQTSVSSEEWWKLTGNRTQAFQALTVAILDQLHILGAEEGKTASHSMMIAFGLQFMALMIGVGFTAWIGIGLSKPIRRASDALERSLRGESSVVPPPPMPESSEIGRISNAVGRFIEAAAERQKLMKEREIANEELGRARREILTQMEHEFNNAAGVATRALQAAATTLKEKSIVMLTTVSTVRIAQDEAHAATESSRETVGEVTRLSDELSRSIAEIAEQTSRTAQLTQEVLGRADLSREAARKFEEVANTIGSIIDLINAIASQTNLLALNATIEAARAGVAGRGFAVVAGEVKELAARTMDATRTIEAQVSELKVIARQAAEQAGGLSGDVGTIQGINTAIAAAVHEQHMTSEGFGRSIYALADAVHTVGEQVNTIAKLGSDAHASAESVQGVAGEMERTTGTLVETLPRIIAETSRRIVG